MLKALVAFIGDPSSVLRAHTRCYTILCNSSSRGSEASDLSGHCTHVYLPANKHIIQLYKHIIKNKSSKIGKNTVWWRIPLIAVLRRQRPADLCELKAILVYIVSRQPELHNETLFQQTKPTKKKYKKVWTV